MKILIADDHALFRQSLRSLLEARGHEVVGEAANGREAVDLARKLQPELVLMDLSMPELDGLAATRLISAELPDVQVVILTASDDDENLFEAIKSGAQGYLLKNLDADAFFDLLDGVSRGEPALTPALARKLMRELSHPGKAPQHGTRRPHRPRARGAGVAGRRHHLEPRASPSACSGEREHGQVPRPQHPRQAPPPEPRADRRPRAPEPAGGTDSLAGFCSTRRAPALRSAVRCPTAN